MAKCNYYEVLMKINQFCSRLYKVGKDEDLILPLIDEVKSFIFSYDELKNLFIQKVQEFQHFKETNEYKDLVNSLYEKITNYITTECNKRDIVVDFTSTLWAKDTNHELGICVQPHYMDDEDFSDDEITNTTFIDVPSLFIYQSFLAINADLNTDSINTTFYITNSIKSFYAHVVTLNPICQTTNQIPQNLSFYLSATNLDDYNSNTFIRYLCASAILEVLNELKEYVNIKIESVYGYKIPKLPEKEKKHKLVLYNKTLRNPFKIDGEIVKISKSNCKFIEDIINKERVVTTKETKTMSKINRIIYKQFGFKLIDKNQYDEYYIDENKFDIIS